MSWSGLEQDPADGVVHWPPFCQMLETKDLRVCRTLEGGILTNRTIDRKSRLFCFIERAARCCLGTEDDRAASMALK
jgi:hypothetical protein